jgi:hypothetical protein
MMSRSDLEDLRSDTLAPELHRQLEVLRRRAEIALRASSPVAVTGVGPAASAEHVAHDRLARNALDLALAGALLDWPEATRRAREILLAYADVYPNLGPHPASRTRSRLYWQALDEAELAVRMAQAYDLLLASDALSAQERERIEQRLLRPLAWLVVEGDRTVDRDNNWASWGIAAAGLIALRLDDNDLLDQALRGSRRDGQHGLWAQLDRFFSDDGYFFEGPGYAAYAFSGLSPLLQALLLQRPDLAPLEYRDGVLRRALRAQAALAYPDGRLPALNDADQDDHLSELSPLAEIVFAGTGDRLALAIAALGRTRGLTTAGFATTRALTAEPPPTLELASVALTDPGGGGIAVLRTADQSVYASLKYSSLGGSHGHYDKLSLVVWVDGREVLPDYGWVRPRNPTTRALERYQPENDDWGRQTVAHTTVVVDGQRQSAGRHPNENNVGQGRFFDASRADVKVASAAGPGLYPDLEQQRTLVLVDRPGGVRYLLDLFELRSTRPRQYDWVLHHLGQPGQADPPLVPGSGPMGTGDGYQFLQRNASATATEPLAYAWSNHAATYRLLQADGADLVAVATSGDARGVLRNEPYLVVRQAARLAGRFASVLDLAREPAAAVLSVRVLAEGPDGLALEVRTSNEVAVFLLPGAALDGRHQLVSTDGVHYGWDGTWEAIFTPLGL